MSDSIFLYVYCDGGTAAFGAETDLRPLRSRGRLPSVIGHCLSRLRKLDVRGDHLRTSGRADDLILIRRNSSTCVSNSRSVFAVHSFEGSSGRRTLGVGF